MINRDDVEELIRKIEIKANDLETKAANENRRRDYAKEIEEWETQALLLRAEAMRLRLELNRG